MKNVNREEIAATAPRKALSREVKKLLNFFD